MLQYLGLVGTGVVVFAELVLDGIGEPIELSREVPCVPGMTPVALSDMKTTLGREEEVPRANVLSSSSLGSASMGAPAANEASLPFTELVSSVAVSSSRSFASKTVF